MNVHEHNGRLTDKQVGVLLILPGLAVFAAIILYPFVNAILMSFTNRSLLFPEYDWIQLENYRKVFADPYFTKTLVTTALFVLGSTIFPYTLGLLWAIVLNQGFKGAEFMRGVTLVNWIIPGTAIGFLWSWIFNGQHSPSTRAFRHWHPVAWTNWNCLAVCHYRPYMADAPLVHGFPFGWVAKCPQRPNRSSSCGWCKQPDNFWQSNTSKYEANRSYRFHFRSDRKSSALRPPMDNDTGWTC